ncbi:MAG: glycerophosphodiester phosphodiesterase family protein [Legionella sp.]|nr:glycerophosphodiester phosphodiesterase family protein [Legionella sp.]
MLLYVIQKMLDGFFAAIPRSRPCAKHINEARVIAHRGVHSNAAGNFENTREAFRRAEEAGCWGIEFDVHTTRDGVYVINHDPTLKRLWEYDVAIANLSFKELRALEPRIPTLQEVVSEFGKKMHLFIELKNSVVNEKILFDELHTLTPGIDYHLITLKASIIKNLTQFPTESLVLVAGHNNVNSFCDLSINHQYGGVLGSYLLFSKKQIEALKNANQLCGLGFVDSKNSLYREINRGVSLIFSNQAVKVVQYLR